MFDQFNASLLNKSNIFQNNIKLSVKYLYWVFKAEQLINLLTDLLLKNMEILTDLKYLNGNPH